MYIIDSEVYCESCFYEGLSEEESAWASECLSIGGPSDRFCRCQCCGEMLNEGELTEQGWLYEALSLVDNILRQPKGIMDYLHEGNLYYWCDKEGGVWDITTQWGHVLSESIYYLREQCQYFARGKEEQILEALDEIDSCIDECLDTECMLGGDELDLVILGNYLKGLIEAGTDY